MRRSIFTLLFVFVLFSAVAQKRFSEGTVYYNVQIENNDTHRRSSSQYIQLIKGSHYRDELISSVGKSVTIFDMREGTGAILKEYGGQKIMIPMVAEQWENKLKKLAAVKFSFSDEKKNILGYPCQRAEATSPDGTYYIVYFTRDLSAENQSMDLQFQQLGGFALEYITTKGNTTVTYTLTSLNFDPVPIQKFDVPNVGYRILSYEESGKMGAY